jgi:hypothetical protein
MSSLWTPGGERPVGRDESAGTEPPAASGAGGVEDSLRQAARAIGIDLDSLSPEEQDQLRAELAEATRVRREVAGTPAPEMLATYMTRFFDLVLIYLDAEPPAFEDAATVIEAFRSMLDGVGDRLGEHQPMLQQALAQAQMIFVQVKEAMDAAESAPEDGP